MRALFALLLVASAAQARKPRPHDARTEGLGHSCSATSACHRGQRCLKTQDANGQPEKIGFCVLPCTPIDAGTGAQPGKPIDPTQAQDVLKKKAPPRCPSGFQCHGQDASTPIDICVKE